jgi:hypothetical protein
MQLAGDLGQRQVVAKLLECMASWSVTGIPELSAGQGA